MKVEGSSWKFFNYGFDPGKESLRESLFTLSNGYMGIRGSCYESEASRIHYPGFYIAGLYNKLPTNISGRTVYNEDMVNCPNWLLLRFKIGSGDWFSPSRNRLLSYKQELDIREGILYRKLKFEDSLGRRTIVKAWRFVHMSKPHLAGIKYTIIPENYDGIITVQSALDGAVLNTGVERYRQLNSKHLTPCSSGTFGSNGAFLSVKTNQSKIEIAEAARLRVFVNNEEKKPVIKYLVKGREIVERVFKVQLIKGQKLDIEKIVSIYTSRDKNVSSPVKEAIGELKHSPRFDKLIVSHKEYWDDLWRKFDIQIEGDNFSQRTIRFHIFHLLQVASASKLINIDAGFPARGLHGEAYRGHIFWDELYILRFFDLHLPEVSRSFLLYRYYRLSKARLYAKKNGYKGAMFPWQSGSTGEEETQTVHLNPLSGEWGDDYSRYQRHVSFAVAYNFWQYYFRTDDKDFLHKYGAEVILSVAMFARSLLEFNPADGRYHSKNVMGPDEFHEKYPDSNQSGLEDNTYTNMFIAWLLFEAKEVLDSLSEPFRKNLFKKINLTQEEVYSWENVARKIKIIINSEGIISQFKGFLSLKEIDWDKYRAKYDKIERMDRILKSEGKSPDEYKVIKQADALMFFYLFPFSEVQGLLNKLGYNFQKEDLKKNYEFYVKRTSHGSTLSKVVHSYLAQLLRRPKGTFEWFLEVLRSDVYDTQGGTTPEGIHTGVMAGSIDLVMRGFAGIYIARDKIVIDPNLPRHWRKIKLKFQFRGVWFLVSMQKENLIVFIQGPKHELLPVPLKVGNRLHYLRYGKRYEFSLKN